VKWEDAVAAAAALAVDPPAIGGALVRALPGPVRDHWLDLLRSLLPAQAPVRRIPTQVSDGRLIGGLDVVATLRAGRPVADRGLLFEADGGIVVLPMVERLEAGAAARITAVLDAGEVVLERDGLAARSPARFGVVALDEAMSADERPPAALCDRLALHLDLAACRAGDTAASVPTTADVARARAALGRVAVGAAMIEALCSTAASLGIVSLRAPFLAVRVTRALAALAGRDVATAEDVTVAARLVLAPRALAMPPPPETESDADKARRNESEKRADKEAQSRDNADEAADPRRMQDIVLEAVLAAIPPDLLQSPRARMPRNARAKVSGRFGPPQPSNLHGRPVGARSGDPRRSARLHLIDTLRAAAPWQKMRRLARANEAQRPIEVRVEDLRIRRYRQRTPTTRVFVVDASGSSALHRLAEVKGAVELVVADCYVRRDRVALFAFRGQAAELMLPPTRSLARAKRALAGMAGGGATPLASGITAGVALADSIRRRGELPMLIFLTDGRANIGLDGSQGRTKAEEDSLQASRIVRAMELDALLVDTSPRPNVQAQRLAEAMGARYVPLPYADARSLARTVQQR
jgi:magnesium chelatase subunit D